MRKKGTLTTWLFVLLALKGFSAAAPELRLIYDRDNLYLGIHCYDNTPSKISAQTMAHDAFDDEGAGDDLIRVLLDPFQDKRNAYIFFVNPRGSRSERLAFLMFKPSGLQSLGSPAIIFLPADADEVYFAANSISRTLDSGRSWSIVSPDLTTNDPAKMRPSGGLTLDNLAVEYGCVVFAIAESPIEKGCIWAG